MRYHMVKCVYGWRRGFTFVTWMWIWLLKPEVKLWLMCEKCVRKSFKGKCLKVSKVITTKTEKWLIRIVLCDTPQIETRDLRLDILHSEATFFVLLWYLIIKYVGYSERSPVITPWPDSVWAHVSCSEGNSAPKQAGREEEHFGCFYFWVAKNLGLW